MVEYMYFIQIYTYSSQSWQSYPIYMIVIQSLLKKHKSMVNHHIQIWWLSTFFETSTLKQLLVSLEWVMWWWQDRLDFLGEFVLKS
jgi:hypothetical protein